MVKWDSSKLKQAVKKSECLSDICKHIGVPRRGRIYDTIRNELKRQGISIQHFKSQSQLAKERSSNRELWTKAEVFVENSPSLKAVKRFIEKELLLEYKCAICGLLPYWNSMELVLQLDHINGEHTDCRIENLRWLCANCHTQTPTYCGRSSYKNPCIICGKSIGKKSIRCSHCANSQPRLKSRRAIHPSKEELEKLIAENSWTTLGKMFGVSDNAVRKWARRYGLIK